MRLPIKNVGCVEEAAAVRTGRSLLEDVGIGIEQADPGDL